MEQEQLNELMKARRQKLHQLKEKGIDPFGKKYVASHYSADIIAHFDELENKGVSLAGRLMSIRRHGKATFADLQDYKGRIQLYFRLDQLGEEKYSLIELFDIGDFIGVEGPVFRTKKGEITVAVHDYRFLTKSLRPLPEKWHGLKDIELRYRQRYVDLIVNEKTRQTFIYRSKIIQTMRDVLNEWGFLEMETPIMQPIAGGALARPFITYHNALGINLYLRIATELHLKRLLVGGLDKVYEIGRIFRNEGISPFHNPEFTSVEIYQSYADYEDMMHITENLIYQCAVRVLGKSEVTFQGETFDLTPPWPRSTMIEVVRKYAGVDFSKIDDDAGAVAAAREAGLELERESTWGEILNLFFETYCEEQLRQPIFILDYPIDISPLAKKIESNPRLTYRFEAFIAGKEVANAFTELNDPIDQRERFERQLARREAGDEEAHAMDEDFVTALEYGMPPAGGLGIGIDRIVMILTDNPSIRDVILFPTLKPR
ncbi:MAG: lysine--tRNA ligase [Firmicutes bacterium]|jgi:lysyl-tRNA synthetase class 2|nr:lysine--tRNA ligase [Bacillota bacterium]HPU02194.1 lysine--tRNA ligase [Bacillota bacterium]